MVKITALLLIKKFIAEKKIKPMKKWSERRSNISRPIYQHLTTLIESIRSLLDLLSGNDMIAMLQSNFT